MEKELLNSLMGKYHSQIIDKFRHKINNYHASWPDNERHLQENIKDEFNSIIKKNKDVCLTFQDQEEILTGLIHEITGLGPIEKLLKDQMVSEIMINGPKEVYVEKEGRIEQVDISFRDSRHLDTFVERILSFSGRRVNQFEPYVDARLKDGSRVNIVNSPLSKSGTVITIKKFSHRVLNINDLIRLNTLNYQVADFLKACVKSKMNMLISGGASTGKTTFLNILTSFIPEGERTIVIEDTREICTSTKNTIFLETKMPNIENKGGITMRDLVKNSLHMRPDRIIVGEVRSDEVLDMIQVMNSGHEGSMTTVHANSAIEALDRLEILTLLGSNNISGEVAKRNLIRAFDIVIHLGRLGNGQRKILQISEVLKSKDYLLKEIFIFDAESGKLVETGCNTGFYNKLNSQIIS